MDAEAVTWTAVLLCFPLLPGVQESKIRAFSGLLIWTNNICRTKKICVLSKGAVKESGEEQRERTLYQVKTLTRPLQTFL